MSIENLNVIDFVSINPDGEAVLAISDHLEWDEQNHHLLALQNKINAYLDGIESESLYDQYPDAKGRRITINSVSKSAPNGDGLIFLQRVAERLGEGGYGFKHLK